MARCYPATRAHFRALPGTSGHFRALPGKLETSGHFRALPGTWKSSGHFRRTSGAKFRAPRAQFRANPKTEPTVAKTIERHLKRRAENPPPLPPLTARCCASVRLVPPRCVLSRPVWDHSAISRKAKLFGGQKKACTRNLPKKFQRPQRATFETIYSFFRPQVLE